MNVLGLDVGRHLGWAVVDYDDGHHVDAGTIDILADEEAALMGNTATTVSDLVRQWSPIAIGIEAPFVHARNVTGATTLLKQHGAVLVGLWRHTIAPAAVAPSTLKKYATGHGHSDKDAMKWAAVRQFGPVAFELGADAVDALWVASWARTDAIETFGGCA